MRLVERSTGLTVVSFDEQHKAHFARPQMEVYFQKIGIKVSDVKDPTFAEKFRDKAVVKLDDPEFELAFIEVYCKRNLNKLSDPGQEPYVWEE